MLATQVTQRASHASWASLRVLQGRMRASCVKRTSIKHLQVNPPVQIVPSFRLHRLGPRTYPRAFVSEAMATTLEKLRGQDRVPASFGPMVQTPQTERTSPTRRIRLPQSPYSTTTTLITKTCPGAKYARRAHIGSTPGTQNATSARAILIPPKAQNRALVIMAMYKLTELGLKERTIRSRATCVRSRVTMAPMLWRPMKTS